MSPRVIPREQRSGGPSLAKVTPATPSTDEAEFVRSLAWRQATNDSLRCTSQNPYSPICEHSYFRDLLLVATANATEQRGLDAKLRGESLGFAGSVADEHELEEVRKRLAASEEWNRPEVRKLAWGGAPPQPSVREEFAGIDRRDLSSSAAAGGEFVPAGGPPLYVAEEFAVAARARGSLADALPSRPLPEVGLKIEVPRLFGGAAVAVHVENAGVQETDPTTALASSARSLIAGQVDMSRQLFDLAQPGFDLVLAGELGRAYAERVDLELIAGTNATGRTQGLANVSGTIGVTFTDASPTAAKTVSKIWEAFRQISEQGGGPPDPTPENYLIVMAPRRAAWSQASYSVPIQDVLPGRVVSTLGARLNLGAGTNEDEIYVIARGEVFIGQERPAFRVYEEVGSGTLTVRLSAVGQLAAMFSRQPKAIAHVSGTGLVNPGVI